MGRLSFVLPLLAFAFGANNASAQSDEIEASSPKFTTLYSFCSQAGCADGQGPSTLVQATNGDFYGTAEAGGGYSGTVFKITRSGTFTTLYRFCSQGGVCADGANPLGMLVQAANGDLYGTTGYGGIAGNTRGNGQCGTIFRISPSGTFTTIYSFCSQAGCADGSNPFAGLVQATNGDLYGTTVMGGADSSACQGRCSTIFKITPSGTLTTLYSFCAQAECPDGNDPLALLQGTDGAFYGTTFFGGVHGYGTIFSLSTGQAPFIETRPASGEIGKAVTILGYKLTGTTSVTFNGKPAAFTIKSPTEITTTVPAGATTGKVEVITPEGTLSSNVAFRVP